MFNVREFGAKGDKRSNDRLAIQSAIDACVKAGGGTVYLPSGDYLSGAIRLYSNVTLKLGAGATLWASRSPQHYESQRSAHLILAKDAEHISIIGPGRIHGQATEDLGWRGEGERPSFRTGIMLLESCKNVIIRDLTILYSDAWTIHLKRCDTVFIDGVTIINNYYRVNSDGIDPNSCRNVHISNCHIVAGDDCIVLKTTEPHPCENVVVTNCTLESIATALKLGTESHGDFRNVHISNCVIRNSSVGIGFYMKDGGIMEGITFSNISIEIRESPSAQVYPIFMDIERRHPDSKIGGIRDVIFRDILIHSGSGILIQGMPQSPIENLTLQNVTLRVNRAEDYSNRRKAIGGRRTTSDERDTLYARQPSYVTLAHINGLTLENLHVMIAEDVFERCERSALICNSVENGAIRNVYRRPVSGEKAPVISLLNCHDMLK
jgi:hypothetical protein